ncbi:MAG: radical SAM protein [Deltaproteobacteria bacterium]|nr:MAG: radical SAM protein [Deltaproteobacteria bacterium]
MRVLLLNPPFTQGIIRDNYCCHTVKADYVWAPSDLLYISGILRGDAFELAVKDAVMEPESWERLLDFCRDWRPEVIISLTSSASYAEDFAGLERLKAGCGAKVFVIGNLPSFEPRRVLEACAWLDGILHNFLDVKLADFLLDPERPPRTISCRTADGDIHIGDVNGIDRADCPLDVPAPQHHLFPHAKYTTPLALARPQTTVLTATGCPYTCSFCIYSPLKLFTRSLDSLRREFDSCRDNGIKELYVVDPTFNADLRFMRQICELLIEEKHELSWACRIHPDRVSLEDFKLLKAAGCHTVQIGVESRNPDTLEVFAPSKQEQQIRRCFALAKEAGLRTLGYFIIGFPDETREQTLNTIDYAIELDPFFASFSNFMPLNGTASNRAAVESGRIADAFQTFDLNGIPVEFSGSALNGNSREELLRVAYRRFYVRPRQVLKYVRDYKNLPLYVKNGLHVLWHQVIN